jgi:hypothetical protein
MYILACLLARSPRYFESEVTLYGWNKKTQDLGEALDGKSSKPMPVGIFIMAYKSRFISFDFASFCLSPAKIYGADCEGGSFVL